MYQYLLQITLVLNPPRNVRRGATQSITGKVLWFSDQSFCQIVQWTGRLGTHVTFVLDINIKKIKNKNQGLETSIDKTEDKPASIKKQAAENKHLAIPRVIWLYPQNLSLS